MHNKWLQQLRLNRVQRTDSRRKTRMYLVGAVVELPVELARVEVGEEGLELAGRLHLGVVGEEVHMPEAVMDLSSRH